MATGGGTEVLVERRGAAAWLTLNRPEAMNALSRALIAAMVRAVDELRGDDSVRALVVTGAGKAFCAGADLKERLSMSLEETRTFVASLNAVLDALAAFPRPVIAALNGLAFGGGLELALACDVRVASEEAEMGLLETRVGIIPGAGGTWRLARVCGVGAAKELILTGRRVPAMRAAQLGLVSEVVPRAEITACVERWVGEVAQCAPLALAQAKQAIDRGFGLPAAEAAALERASYEVALASDDRDEGLRAFAEKRKPAFKGR